MFTFLIDNIVLDRHLIAEHGFAVLLEIKGFKILFDTGQSSNLLKNAQNLNIDLKDIDFVVISHGHYDHTGGLIAFLSLNKKAKVYLKKEAILPKYKNDKNIGVNFNFKDIKDRCIFVEEEIAILKDVYLMPKIKIYNKIDTHFDNMFTTKDKIKDQFLDELFLVFKENEKLNIITGCSHRGITNIIKTAMDFFQAKNVFSVVGGFHFKNIDSNKLAKITKDLKNLNPNNLVVSHCSGIENYSYLKEKLKNTNVSFSYVGKIIN